MENKKKKEPVRRTKDMTNSIGINTPINRPSNNVYCSSAWMHGAALNLNTHTQFIHIQIWLCYAAIHVVRCCCRDNKNSFEEIKKRGFFRCWLLSDTKIEFIDFVCWNSKLVKTIGTHQNNVVERTHISHSIYRQSRIQIRFWLFLWFIGLPQRIGDVYRIIGDQWLANVSSKRAWLKRASLNWTWPICYFFSLRIYLAFPFSFEEWFIKEIDLNEGNRF